jgi:hypothetical protein
MHLKQRSARMGAVTRWTPLLCPSETGISDSILVEDTSKSQIALQALHLRSDDVNDSFTVEEKEGRSTGDNSVGILLLEMNGDPGAAP